MKYYIENINTDKYYNVSECLEKYIVCFAFCTFSLKL